MNVKCPSCGKEEIELALRDEKNTCANCGFVLESVAFLRSLVKDNMLKVEGFSNRFTLKYYYKNGSVLQIAKLEFYEEDSCVVTEVTDLDSALPLLKELQKYFSDLKVLVKSGFSRNLTTCPLCDARDFELTNHGSVICKACKKIELNVFAMVYSRLTADIGVSYKLNSNVLEVFTASTPKTIYLLWFLFPQIITIDGELIARFQLRKLPGEKNFVLAVEVPNSCGEEDKQMILGMAEHCLKDLCFVKIMENVKIL